MGEAALLDKTEQDILEEELRKKVRDYWNESRLNFKQLQNLLSYEQLLRLYNYCVKPRAENSDILY